ncbi:MAG: alpha-L-rhamnosidase C-terminal domain-containing protein, partial [Bacteroidota bacterium]
AYSTSLLVKAAEVLGKEEDLAAYSDLLQKIKIAFQDEFVSGKGRLSPHSQTSYVLALHFGLLADDQRPYALNYLIENIERRGYHLSTGFLGTPYLCHVLSDNGREDVAYRLLMQDTYPSWLYPISRGATTIWERWDGIKPDSTFQNEGMNSFNHYAYGAIGDWMYANVGGIRPGAPGYKHIIIAPKVNGDLNYANTSLESPYGKVATSWKRTDSQVNLEVTIPPNTTASVRLPGEDDRRLGSGTHQITYTITMETN